MLSKGELCRDGSTWERDLDLTDTRPNSLAGVTAER